MVTSTDRRRTVNSMATRERVVEVGDLVLYRLGPTDVHAEVIEDRGPVGFQGAHLVRVRLDLTDTKPVDLTVAVDELRPLSLPNQPTTQPDAVPSANVRHSARRSGRRMAGGDIETYYEDGQWKNRPQGNQRASNAHDTKADAQKAGRDMAIDRGVEHVIKKMDGTIGEKNTYPRSRDPRTSKG